MEETEPVPERGVETEQGANVEAGESRGEEGEMRGGQQDEGDVPGEEETSGEGGEAAGGYEPSDDEELDT